MTTKLKSKYTPDLAIMVYKNEDGFDTNYYLESHEINEQGQILSGKPLLQESIQGMVDCLFDARKDSSLLYGETPENLMLYRPLPGGHYRMIWYRPAEIRNIFFAKGLKIPSGKAWVPAMVYSVDQNALEVFAIKTNSRPKHDTTIYRAPFHNVDQSGDVCLGSARVKKPVEKTFQLLIKYWEDLFWLSEFAHRNGGDEVVKTDLADVWKDLMQSKTTKKWSDIDELISTKKKFKALL